MHPLLTSLKAKDTKAKTKDIPAKPPTKAQADLAAALSDPLNARIADCLQIWGEAVPLEAMRDLTARTGKSLAALRDRQRRLTKLLIAAGQPPEPLFDLGEVVCLRSDESVVGVVASLTGRTVQIRLAPDASSWIAVRHHEIRRVKPRQRPEPDGLSRGQRVLAERRRRQALLKAATKTTTN